MRFRSAAQSAEGQGPSLASGSRWRGVASIGASLVLGGCGLEGLFSEVGDDEHQRPRTTLLGTVDALRDFPLDRARFQVLAADGREVEIFDQRVEGNGFDLALAEAAYPNARLMVTVGGTNLLALIPEIRAVDGESEFDRKRGLEPTRVTVSRASTVEALVFVAKLTGLGRSLQTTDAIATSNTLASIALAASTSTLARVRSVVDILVDRSDPTAPTSTTTLAIFQWPEFQPMGQPITRATVEGTPTVAASIDFGPLGMASGNLARLRFDQLLAGAAEGVRIQECLDPNILRVVIEVDFNQGKVDGACNVLNRFKWVRDEPGKSMFFVGGIHETSPVQDTNIDAKLGNPGSWTPNTVPMFDDGTNGDSSAGDNIWTVTFDLPRQMRIGYKFTWGQRGDLWTGSEEWPGNQRILEVADVNGDGLVYRRDNFGDEATNKDLANLRVAMLTFETDSDSDGIPDARERHDLNNDCRPDPLVTPTGVGPATVPPNTDGTCPERQ